MANEYLDLTTNIIPQYKQIETEIKEIKATIKDFVNVETQNAQVVQQMQVWMQQQIQNVQNTQTQLQQQIQNVQNTQMQLYRKNDELERKIQEIQEKYRQLQERTTDNAHTTEQEIRKNRVLAIVGILCGICGIILGAIL